VILPGGSARKRQSAAIAAAQAAWAAYKRAKAGKGGKTVLREVINATVGFEQLAADLRKPSKSLHRMLGPRGNPNTANFFAILRALQKRVGVTLTVRVA
jgi:hypothetical protein